MHVVIDLGEKRTQLACWESAQAFDQASIRVSIPGTGAFKIAPNRDSWDRENLRDYLSHLQREYLLPSRKTVESAAMVVPGIWTLKNRSELLEVAEEILGLEESQIIPQPLALISGYNLRHHNQPLRGDILLIQMRESCLEFALLSSSETAGIILEKQFRGDISQARQELTANGYHGAAGWRLDYVLATDSQPLSPGLEEFLATLAAETQVIFESDLNFTAAEGLYGARVDQTIDPSRRLSLIYPYEFYLETNESDRNPTNLQRIPFDTTNLELACDGIYPLTSLDSGALYNLALESNRVKFRIYEFPFGYQPAKDQTLASAQPVWEIDSPRNDLPPQMVVILDMAAARLHLELELERTSSFAIGADLFRLRLTANQDRLLQLISHQGGNPMLVEGWEEHRRAYQPDGAGLAHQVQSTLFHLYALTQLWHVDPTK